MKLVFPIVMGVCMLFGLSAFSLYQHGTIKSQKETIADSSRELNYVSESLEKEVKSNLALNNVKIDLEDKVYELRDSVQMLKNEISKLKRIISSKSGEIKALKEKLAGANAAYAQIKQEIASIAQSDQIDKDRITALENEKARLRQQIESMEQEKIKIALAKVQTEQKMDEVTDTMVETELDIEQKENEIQQGKDMMIAELEKARFEKLADILNNTQVRFESVKFRKKRYSKDMSRLRKKSWKYTIMNFYIEHNHLKNIVDENFVLKIIDTDKKEILSYVENNPNFPNNHLKLDGLQFKFDGNMVEIIHHNDETKESKNYEVQLFYVDENGEENMLLNGMQQIVAEGKPVLL